MDFQEENENSKDICEIQPTENNPQHSGFEENNPVNEDPEKKQDTIKNNNQSTLEGTELSYKDINLRLHTKEEFYMFFTHVNQRLLPTISSTSAEYFRHLLTGEKKCLKLLDSRDYYFPKPFMKHELLNASSLYKICSSSTEIINYLPIGCRDSDYMIKLLATLDPNKLIEIDDKIKQEVKHLTAYIYLC
jgi:hypothetical protein